MFWSELHSGQSLGTSLTRVSPERERYAEGSDYATGARLVRSVRVVVGRLGALTRLTATELNLVVDGLTFDKAWSEFLEIVRTREDAPWLTFDVDRVRAEELLEALDAPEDDDWSEPADGAGGND